jgi:ligand-binding sensor domain-containing protein
LLATIRGAFTLKREGGKWALRPIHEEYRNNVYNVIEDKDGHLWAGADNAVVRFVKSQEGFEPKEFTLENGQLERVLVANIEGSVHLLVPSGVLRMEATGPVKAAIAGLENRSRLDFFLSDSGPVWVHAEGEWTVLNGGKDQTLLTYLPIFEDIRHLSIDRQGRLLVVDEGREIYSIDPRQATGSATAFSVFIRKATL